MSTPARPTLAAEQSRPLAVSMGDPAGIGLDIAIEAYRRDRDRVPPFVLVADPAEVARRADRLGVDVRIGEVASAAEAAAAFAGRLPVLPLKVSRPVEPGRPDPANAPAVIAAIEAAVALVHRGEAAAVVTLPISKRVLHEAGFTHPGHTEFLAELAGRHHGGTFRPVMMLAAEELRVVPLTVHVPIREVPGLVTEELIVETAGIVARDLSRRLGIARPRLAVAGLNPHAGEGGSIGDEEARIVAPAIRRLVASGLEVTGPHPADTMFHAAARARYDIAIAMYHDQALIPLKTLAFDRGVNVTLGLPFVRTSPDHGTAFDIAGTGRADRGSLLAALTMARDLSGRPEGHGAAEPDGSAGRAT
ncbi:MAG: 4-hydroxythreonine-4-phosphate dehydrogenase PdxA [Hyphomicrobiaceae bacterium]